MKKIICVFLSMILIFCIALFSVDAFENFTNYEIKTSKIIPLPCFDIYDENGETIYAFNDDNGQRRTFFYMFTAQNNDGSEFTLLINYKGSIYCGDTIHYSVLGDCALLSRGDYWPGVYFIISDGKMAEINEAYKNGMFDSEILYQELKNHKGIDGYWCKDNDIVLVGDVNHDTIVSVADATNIQLAVAGFNTIKNKVSADTDGNGKITIVDATTVQKKVALMDENYGYYSDSVFSGKIKIE